jgi:methionyl-tRNA formyltransferase
MEKSIIFMGTPEFAVPILSQLVQSPYHVAAVYTRPDKEAGRGRQLGSSPVKKLAQQQGIPVVQPRTLKTAEAVEEMVRLKPDLVVVAAFGYILPGELLSVPKSGCLNVHPSLLPTHRGPSPIADTILSGDAVTGVSIILMDEGVDSGPILAQRQVDVSPEDTTGSLTARLGAEGAGLLLEVLPRWLAGALQPHTQEEGRATYSRLITSGEGELDWELTAEELWRQVRAFNPWPGCHSWWKGRRLKIHSATPLGDRAGGPAGEVVALGKSSPSGVGVVAGQGILGLGRVQLEGKREFARGQRDFVGSVLGSPTVH